MPEATPLPIPMSAPAQHEACAGCGAPVTADARYCLNCGTRQPGAAPAFLDALEEPPAPAPAPIPPVTLPQPDTMRTGPLALIAVILLALIVGLLAGHWLGDRDNDKTATQVIRVDGQGASAAAPAAAAEPSTAVPATSVAPPATTAAPQVTAAAPAGTQATP